MWLLFNEVCESLFWLKVLLPSYLEIQSVYVLLGQVPSSFGSCIVRASLSCQAFLRLRHQGDPATVGPAGSLKGGHENVFSPWQEAQHKNAALLKGSTNKNTSLFSWLNKNIVYVLPTFHLLCFFQNSSLLIGQVLPAKTIYQVRTTQKYLVFVVYCTCNKNLHF